MENTQKINNLKNSLVLKVFVFMLLAGFYFWYLVNQYNTYKENKELLTQEINKFDLLKSKWLSYDEYKLTLTPWSPEELLMTKIWKDFFDQNFNNTENKDYLSFLNDKQKKLAEKKLDPEIISREEKLQKVLPSYTQWIIAKWNMSDLEFINYIENLIKSFNLVTDSKIWITEVIPLEEWKTLPNWKKIQDNLSTQLFYIPVKLELTWKKADIVEFLYYVQKSWIVTSVNDSELKFFSDPTRIVSKQIIWSNSSSNIYENKILDISDITFKEYIDNSIAFRTSQQFTTEWLVKFVKNNEEKNQEFKIDLTLEVYVKWLPLYVLDNYIQNVISNYNKMKWQNEAIINLVRKNTKQILNNNKTEIIWYSKTLTMFFENNDEVLKQLQFALKDKTKLDLSYQKAYKLNNDLIIIKKLISDINEKINVLNK